MKRCPWCNHKSNKNRCPKCRKKKSDAFIGPLTIAFIFVLACYGIMFIGYFFK